jgi:alanyl-tRNA synthetase
MKFLSSDEIRESFLEYFESREHHRIQGSSLLPDNDPTLLFINSGMAPLKAYFTGVKKPPAPNLCNVQPCIRTRDIDDVGDRHHLTFFEMLGSWSIGGYFKQRAVELAYALLADRFGFPKDKLYVSVYSGDPALGLEPDEETARAWEQVGVPRDHIVYLGEDNFWGPAGETGPCGPCTEMFFDTGEEYAPTYRPGGEFDTKRRYIEVWNAGVFMQLDKKADGTFDRLPFFSVDTGSGLERMAMVLQGARSVYETDLFTDIMKVVWEGVASKLPEEACRIIADHVRSACAILSEGVLPGNEGRSYIPRRLIRKCVALINRAGIDTFDYDGAIDQVVRQLGSHYPLLVERRNALTFAFLREIQEFERVIGKGLERVEQLSNKPTPFTISGKDAFGLFATYGLPVEITREFVKEKGGLIDEESYQAEFHKHQEISRAKGRSAKDDGWEDNAARLDELLRGQSSEFVGYDSMEADAKVTMLAQNGNAIQQAREGAAVEIVTSATPFYAEGGGQVGDRGEIFGEGGTVAKVVDTRKLGSTHVHIAEIQKGVLRGGDSIHLAVDQQRRRATMANHTATHLLHAALREVLGAHVRQAGSLVDSERLRFDFDNPSKVTPEQLQAIERRVNEFVRANHERETSETSYAKAVESGALAFFGEKYGDVVRILRFGPASTELCGGTHVPKTGDIGTFRIVSEAGVASGVRRIVAITGDTAVLYTQEQDRLLRELSARLKVPSSDLVKKVDQLICKGDSQKGGVRSPVTKIDTNGRVVTLAGGLPFVAARIDSSPEDLSDEAIRVANEIGGVAVLAGESNGKASLVVAVRKDKSGQYNASKLLSELAPYVNGKGGGSAYLARGGGTDPNGIDILLTSAVKHVAAITSEPA